ncbi:MAG: hypothetical protein Q8P16_01560 [bacterium]|nr:hypothetical protein [bacterium]
MSGENVSGVSKIPIRENGREVSAREFFSADANSEVGTFLVPPWVALRVHRHVCDLVCDGEGVGFSDVRVRAERAQGHTRIFVWLNGGKEKEPVFF